MSARRIEVLPLPEFLRPKSHLDGAVLAARHIVKSFGGIRAVQDVDISVADRTLHALIGPNGAGKTTAFNLLSGMYTPDEGTVSLLGQPIAGQTPEDIARAGIGRSFQITNLFPALSVGRKHPACRAGAASPPLRSARQRVVDRSDQRRDRRHDPLSRPCRHRKGRGRHAVLWRPAPARHGRGARHRAADPAAGRAARRPCCGGARAYRRLIKRISTDMPVLLVEHDIDRVFQLADQVTVMNDGRVLLDGSVEDARASSEGAGSLYRLRRHRSRRAAARNRRPPQRAADGKPCRYVLRQEPYSQRRQLHAARKRDHRAARPQWRRQVDAAENADRDRAGRRTARSGSRRANWSGFRPRKLPVSASATCRRAAACSPA